MYISSFPKSLFALSKLLRHKSSQSLYSIPLYFKGSFIFWILTLNISSKFSFLFFSDKSRLHINEFDESLASHGLVIKYTEVANFNLSLKITSFSNNWFSFTENNPFFNLPKFSCASFTNFNFLKFENIWTFIKCHFSSLLGESYSNGWLNFGKLILISPINFFKSLLS